MTSISSAQNEWWKNASGKELDKKHTTKMQNNNPQDFQGKDSSKAMENVQPGDVNVKKSASIAKIIKFKSATVPPNIAPTMEGYRIQLFFDQDRDAVNKARSEVMQIDDETTTYIEYRAPNYLLLLGDFRQQLDAEKVRAKLISNFPEAIVIEDEIYLPKLKEKKGEEHED
ncbi:hypothetical protein [Brumimicrobium salinarum]|uniref:hypothetical protein n=1 Tax=Brumimicrobium salinarum TaxID=2058658 RepID=UPI001054F7F3|nr:hypothetical protein [Brumimicrobium salinarum]